MSRPATKLVVPTNIKTGKPQKKKPVMGKRIEWIFIE